jgi:hypothetical protein
MRGHEKLSQNWVHSILHVFCEAMHMLTKQELQECDHQLLGAAEHCYFAFINIPSGRRGPIGIRSTGVEGRAPCLLGETLCSNTPLCS